MTKKEEQARDRAETIATLRKMLKPGSTVHSVIRHVARSGMSRTMDFYFLKGGESHYLTGYMAQLGIGTRTDKGLRVGGCGMDMGFHCVYTLSSILYRDGYKCLKGKDGKKRCPSSYHNNHRDRVTCGEKRENGDWVRCYRSDDRRSIVIEGEPVEVGWVYKRDGEDTPCPKCGGEGSIPNPEGPERFDLRHTDGYAISQRWM
jgi:hypothetical protein